MKITTFITILVLSSFLFNCSSIIYKTEKEKTIALRKWTIHTALETPFRAGFRPYEVSTPAVKGDTLFTGNTDGVFTAINALTGQILWKFYANGGIESSPHVWKKYVYFGANDGYVYALNRYNGELIWKDKLFNEIMGELFVKKDILYVATADNIVYFYDAKTGKKLPALIKREFSSKMTVRWISTPVYYKGTLYMGFSDGYFIAANAIDGHLLWEKKLNFGDKFQDIDATPYVNEKNIIVATYDGRLYSLDRQNGDVRWFITKGSSYGVVVDNDILYYAAGNGYVYALNQANGDEIWKFKVDSGIPSRPLIHNNYVILGSSHKYVYILNKITGKILWKDDIGSGINMQPAVYDNLFYVMTTYGNLYAYKIY